MKLSVIVATRDRAHAIIGCLESIAASIENARPVEAEIVVVDNGSKDGTSTIVRDWADKGNIPVRLLLEKVPGVSIARNLGIRQSQGTLLAFTDDDCRLSRAYVSQLLEYDKLDGDDLVLRGGRVELGDPTDLPLSIKTVSAKQRFNKITAPAIRDCVIGQVSGCNMAMRRAVIERIGYFDERFGPGRPIAAGEEGEHHIRAYLQGITLEYVPDMTVYHYHGRKDKSVGYKLIRDYAVGSGAVYGKYILRHPELCLPLYWDMKKSIRELLTGKNLFCPVVDFSFTHKMAYSVFGVVKYFLSRKGA